MKYILLTDTLFFSLFSSIVSWREGSFVFELDTIVKIIKFLVVLHFEKKYGSFVNFSKDLSSPLKDMVHERDADDNKYGKYDFVSPFDFNLLHFIYISHEWISLGCFLVHQINIIIEYILIFRLMSESESEFVLIIPDECKFVSYSLIHIHLSFDNILVDDDLLGLTFYRFWKEFLVLSVEINGRIDLHVAKREISLCTLLPIHRELVFLVTHIIILYISLPLRAAVLLFLLLIILSTRRRFLQHLICYLYVLETIRVTSLVHIRMIHFRKSEEVRLQFSRCCSLASF